jgi:hypothetical protein
MRPNPTVPRQASLEAEKKQAGNPGDSRKQQSQHGKLSKDVIGSAERAAEKKRQGAVGEIAGNQDRPDPAIQEKSRLRLRHHDGDEVLGFDCQEVGSAHLQQQLNSVVVGGEYVERKKKARNDAQNEE